MKTLIKSICVFYFLGSFFTLYAQINSETSDYISTPDYNQKINSNTIRNVDTIPDFFNSQNKLKITGVIYESDGITPAKDAVLHIYHADENGDYKISEEIKYNDVYHNATIRTNSDGRYTFYTFIPGSAYESITFPPRRGAKKIFAVVRDQDNFEYELNAFVFEDDPLLSKSCRRRIQKRGTNNILDLKLSNESIYVAQKNITLLPTNQ